MNRSTFKIVLKQVGSLLILMGIIFTICIPISIIYSEWYSALGFLISGIISSGMGFIIYKGFYFSDEPLYHHALMISALSWLIGTMVGGLPFYVIAHITPVEVMNNYIPHDSSYTFSSLIYFKNYIHCFFESMSAYTTCGLTMAVHEPSVGKGVLFYRSLAQWLGGAGFIIMALAIFKQFSGKSAVLLYGSEATGMKLRPRIAETTRYIWKAYLIVTLFSFVYLLIGTYIILPDYPLKDNIFDSINHAMAGQSTGGFSTLDNSIAEYNSSSMDMLYLLPMIIGSFSLPFFYKVIFEKRISEFWNDIQTRGLIITFFIGSIIQSLLLLFADSVSEPFLEGIFQFVSALSTTGWQTANFANWDWLSIVFIVSTAFFIGGASGSTAGGIKMIRAELIIKGLRWQVNKVFLSENTIKTIRFNNKTMLPDGMNEEFTQAASYAIMFFMLIMISAILGSFLTGNSFDFADSLFESASAQSTAGLSCGITDPSMSPFLEIVYIFQMWAGRLEFIPVLALIRVIFWGTNPRKI
ncbi:MAG: TrkH family potassium uptake protein [Bacteroidales bacterium]